MNKVIWKFPLKLTDIQDVLLPIGAQILSVAEQNGVICLWAIVNPEEEKATRSIEIHGTGNDSFGPGSRTFLGTVVMNPFVWHVFEVSRF